MVRGDSPWAVEVTSYGAGEGFYAGYTLKNSALGRPTVDTYEDAFVQNPSVTVVPAFPPWDPTELVSIGGGGHLVLKMGRAIVNHPDNPYGVDFLIFGNSFFQGSGLYNQNANDPRTYTLAGQDKIGINTKNGVVSVSVDGIHWFYFQNQPRLGMLPTLGRVWLEEEGEWGDPTDPTVPPDPALHVKDLANMPLVKLIEHYRGGAGGTGFDLSDLIVPPGKSLPKKFHYVRIEVPVGQFRTEIDAVSVVRPASERRRWEIRHFPWVQDPAVEKNAVGMKLNSSGAPALLHPDAGELPGWVLEWSPSLRQPDWRDVEAETPTGAHVFFRGRRIEEEASP
ncbi:MAG: hypothetical protein JJU29_07605 [Verrucomicrobia bacterium]|nr:hypothetical protein [Verrucomicrobiota bacterium]MCH8511632.1 hypothetical protein [Kiritimatiellia bacterium]